MAKRPELPCIFHLVRRLNLHTERSRTQAGTNTDSLRGEADVPGYFRRPEVRAPFMDGNVDLAELQLGDGSQGLLKGITSETERGTGYVHGCLLHTWKRAAGAFLSPPA